jgi:hypothetical protein
LVNGNAIPLRVFTDYDEGLEWVGAEGTRGGRGGRTIETNGAARTSGVSAFPRSTNCPLPDCGMGPPLVASGTIIEIPYPN